MFARTLASKAFSSAPLVLVVPATMARSVLVDEGLAFSAARLAILSLTDCGAFSGWMLQQSSLTWPSRLQCEQCGRGLVLLLRGVEAMLAV